MTTTQLAPRRETALCPRRPRRLRVAQLQDADVFVSDVHLSEETPEVSDRFLRFLNLVETSARRLFLLGDIFDFWTGWGQSALPHVAAVLDRLHQLHRAGIEVHYLAGNRDLNFDVALDGAQAVFRAPDTMSVESYGRRIFLTHGDLLCTRDKTYLQARRITRSWLVRTLLRSMPLCLSGFVGRGYRRLSTRATKRKARPEIAMDFGRVRSHLHNGHDIVVCGHVHRARRYRIDREGRGSAEFFTLGDWCRAGAFLAAAPGHLELHRFE